MIYLKLFLAFLKIGAVSFGGGYGMIALIRETVLNNGWLTEEECLSFIAVAESTPGPIAVNMATFVGSSRGGILGAFLATLGVVTPSFIIILLIAICLSKVMKYKGVQAVLKGVRPSVVALILSTAIVLFLSTVFGIKTISSAPLYDWKGIILFLLLGAGTMLYLKIKKKTPSPIILIVISAVYGVIFMS